MILLGCGPTPPFASNRLMLKRVELESETSMQGVEKDLAAFLEETFGTPDVPRWPSFLAEGEFESLHQPEWLERAAGPVGRAHDKIERGLYRKHCAHCHALNGDGAGPTAYFQNPYPRDFRRGTFKFKSTSFAAKPTWDDLVQTLDRGIVGTAMPSFRSLHGGHVESGASATDDEVAILVHYVRYLAIRGEAERRIILKAPSQLDLEKGERLWDPRLKDSDAQAFQQQTEWLIHVCKDVARSWLDAPKKIIAVDSIEAEKYRFPQDFHSEKRESLIASIERGKALFRSPTAACFQCHGKNGEGDGAIPDFDEWTKDWTIRAGIDPKDRKAWKAMKPYGALSPVRDFPRNLRLGVYRGGSDAESIYRRIVGGIEGSPMPPIPTKREHPTGMAENDLWDLVRFVQSLPYEEVDGILAASTDSSSPVGASPAKEVQP